MTTAARNASAKRVARIKGSPPKWSASFRVGRDRSRSDRRRLQDCPTSWAVCGTANSRTTFAMERIRGRMRPGQASCPSALRSQTRRRRQVMSHARRVMRHTALLVAFALMVGVSPARAQDPEKPVTVQIGGGYSSKDFSLPVSSIPGAQGVPTPFSGLTGVGLYYRPVTVTTPARRVSFSSSVITTSGDRRSIRVRRRRSPERPASGPMGSSSRSPWEFAFSRRVSAPLESSNQLVRDQKGHVS